MVSAEKNLIAVVGTFDGVHCGHRSLLAELVHAAGERSMSPAVVTFTTHPLATLRPECVPPLLATPELKRRLIAAAGVERIIELDFTPALAGLTASRFMAMLRNDYGVRHLLLGFNTAMGCDMVSSPAEFRKTGSELGVDVTQAGEYRQDAGGVSSSAIRRALSVGDVTIAAAMLGRNYSLCGTVVHGKALGRTLGFPTANIEPRPASQALPAAGVYACRVEVANAGTFDGMVNVGRRPTVDCGGRITVEAHLFDCSLNLYGRDVCVEFVSRLRDERRFDSLDALQAQLAADAEAARRYFR